MRRRRVDRAPSRRGLGGLIVVLVVSVLAPRAVRAAAPDWSAALQSYAQDPFRNRRALLGLHAQVGPETPPIYVLAVADAQLRAKRFAAARRAFDDALGRGLDEPWATWARLGLAWTALGADEVDTARLEFARVANGSGRLAAVGGYALALLDAADRVPGVEARFRALAADPAAGQPIQGAARLGAAYARYWAGDYEGARALFEAYARAPDVLELRDDARYAAAWARARAGDVAGARRALAALAGGRGRRVSRSLVNLEPRALVQAGVRRYREGPLRVPEDQVATLADGDGAALARAALGWMAKDVAFAPRAPLAVWRVAEGHARPAPPAPSAPRPARADGASTPGTRWWLALAVSVVGLVATWIYARGRTTAAGPSGFR